MRTRFMTCLALVVSITLVLLTAYCHYLCIDALERDLRVADSAVPIYQLNEELPEG